MISEAYACAYKEVIELLKYTNKEDVNKIPRYRILLWKKNMKKDYDFKVDINKPLSEQNFSNETKAILANIFKRYWATDYQKQRILDKEKYDMEIEEANKSLKYNPDDLFKNRTSTTSNLDETKTTIALVEYKESFVSKIFNKIKQFFVGQ